jgi:hypothetical protein
MTSVLQNLLHIDTTTASIDQQKMINRIITEDQACDTGGKMLCLVDSLLRNISRNLINEGIIESLSKSISMNLMNYLQDF